MSVDARAHQKRMNQARRYVAIFGSPAGPALRGGGGAQMLGESRLSRIPLKLGRGWSTLPGTFSEQRKLEFFLRCDMPRKKALFWGGGCVF